MVGGLWNRRKWAYPFALVSLTGFIVYEVYRMTFAYSLGLGGVSALAGGWVA